MKKQEVPQDDANLFEGKMKELQYAVDEDGNYTTVKSVGWEAKNEVMLDAWSVENDKIEKALERVKSGERSPLYYYLYKCLMDISILKKYTRFSRFKIKRHFKPKYFEKLTDEQLDKYVYAFGLKDRSQLTNFSPDED